MATGNLDAFNLKAVQTAGLVNEEVLQRIYDISPVPLSFSDMTGSDTTGNDYVSWIDNDLGAPNPENKVADGADASGNDTQTGSRQGNYCQIPSYVLPVSTRANASNTIGYARETTNQIQRAQRRIRRDLEARYVSHLKSAPGDGDTVPSEMGGLAAWCVSNVSGGASRVAGGFQAATAAESVVDAPTPGTKRPLTQTIFDTVAQLVYEQGGDPTVAMSPPSIKALFSGFLFDSSARVAQLYSDQGKSREDAAALGSVSVYIGHFSTFRLVPNRMMLPYQSLAGSAGDAGNMLLMSPEYLSKINLYSFRLEELGKTGLSTRYQLSADCTLGVLSEKAQGLIADIDVVAAVTA